MTDNHDDDGDNAMTTIMMMICNDNYNNGDVDDNDKQPVKHHRDELPILLDFVRLLLLFGQLSHISGYKYQIHVDFNISKYVNIILLEPQYTTIYLGTNIVLFGLQYITIYLGLNIILFGYYLNIWLAKGVQYHSIWASIYLHISGYRYHTIWTSTY